MKFLSNSLQLKSEIERRIITPEQSKKIIKSDIIRYAIERMAEHDKIVIEEKERENPDEIYSEMVLFAITQKQYEEILETFDYMISHTDKNYFVVSGVKTINNILNK